MTKIKFLAFIFPFLAMQACISLGSYKGNGNVIKQQKSVGDYTQISTNGSIDVILTDGKVGDLTVEAESNLIDLVETDVAGGTLQIKIKDGIGINFYKGIKVYVPVDNRLSLVSTSGSGDVTTEKNLNSPELTVQSSGSGDITLNSIQALNFHAKLSGSGNFSSPSLQCGNADISVAGSGNATLAGKTTALQIKLSGSADLKAPDLVADSVAISIAGSGNATVNAQKTLSASINGSGEIRYTGAATVTKQTVSGSGSITKF